MNARALSVAVLMFASASLAVGEGVGGFQYYGIAHVSWWFDEYTYTNATASRNELAGTNANWAAVLVSWYQSDIKAGAIAAISNKSPTDAAVRQAVTEFHNQGMKVMLKPHVDVNDGNWRGNINPADKDAWFASYTQFILKYAQMAESQGVEMLCIGTELKAVSGSVNQARWYAVIDAIRAVYKGTLTYAANATGAGDEFTSVSFWDRLDLIGLDGYFALTNRSDPTLAQLVAAWHGNAGKLDIVSTIKNFADAHRKPVIFTEIGYKSSAGTNTEPWNYNHVGAFDLTEQRNCMDAVFTVWSQQSAWMKGFFWWAWPVPVPSSTDQDYNPRNKPAADVLRAWQSAPDARNAVTNTASYSADSVAPGAIVSLWGAGLSAGTVASSQLPLPSTLGDTTVTINGIPAPLYFVSPQQVNAQVPYEAPIGSAVAEVVSKSGMALTMITVRAAGPGIFTLNGQGTGDGALLNAATFALVTSEQPIAAGGDIAIYCTGLGSVTPAAVTGSAPPVPLPSPIVAPEVRIDGQPVTVLGAVLAPQFVGLYQVNAHLPEALSAGAHQLQIVSGGAASNIVTLATRLKD